jgi:hypothetical protein
MMMVSAFGSFLLLQSLTETAEAAINGLRHRQVTPPLQQRAGDNHVINHRKQRSNSTFDASLDLSQDPETRIIGGSPATEGDYPYYVALDGCGASLIAPRVVLSAGESEHRENV